MSNLNETEKQEADLAMLRLAIDGPQQAPLVPDPGSPLVLDGPQEAPLVADDGPQDAEPGFLPLLDLEDSESDSGKYVRYCQCTCAM